VHGDRGGAVNLLAKCYASQKTPVNLFAIAFSRVCVIGHYTLQNLPGLVGKATEMFRRIVVRWLWESCSGAVRTALE